MPAAAAATGGSDTADGTYFDTYEPGNTDVNILNGGTTAQDGDVTYSAEDGCIYLVQSDGTQSMLLSADTEVQNLNVQNGSLYYTVQEQDTAYIKTLDPETLAAEDVASLDGSIAQMYAVSDHYFCYLLDGTVYGLDAEQDTTERLTEDNVFSFAVTEYGLVYAEGDVFDLTVYVDDTPVATDIQTYYTDDGYLILNTVAADYQIELSSAFEGDVETTEMNLHGTVAVDELFVGHTEDCPECAANYQSYLDGEITLEDYVLEETETHTDSTSGVLRTLSTGQENIVKRAYQQATIKWTPLEDVSGWREQTTFTAGTTYTGMPYGQPILPGYYVPNSASFTTFITAVNTAGSVFYTEQAYNPYNAGSIAPYYSSDCSSFVSWSWGIGRQTTSSLGGYATVIGTGSSLLTSQVGDALNSASVGHCALVTKIEYDSTGAVTAIEITEQTPPIAKTTRYGEDGSYTLAYLQEKYSAYSLLRYNNASSVTYTADPNVPLSGESGYVYTVSPFMDITSSDWYYASVLYAYQNGIFAGVADRTFAPLETMTRGQLVTILGKVSGIDGTDYAYTGVVTGDDLAFRTSASTSGDLISRLYKGNIVSIIGVSGDWYQVNYQGTTGYVSKQYVTAGTGTFSDVGAGLYYTGFVEWAYAKGITSGISATTFGPTDSITRQDLCRIIYLYCEIYGIELEVVKDAVTFTDDANISDYAREAVSALQQAGIISGDSGAFRPKDKISRAEVASIFTAFHRDYLS